MFAILCSIIALFAATTAIRTVLRTRDALHPAVFTAPLFGFFYGIWPILLNWNSDLLSFFTSAQLDYVEILYALTVVAFCAGVGTLPTGDRAPIASKQKALFDRIVLTASAESEKKIRRLSLVLGAMSAAAYWYALGNAGGFMSAYNSAKGGGYTDSGYIGDAPLLSFPAIGLLALSRRGKPMRLADVMLALVIDSPHLLQGTFGGRRGPLFLGLSALFVAWYIARNVRPRLTTVVLGVSAITIAVATVGSQRRYVYLGSEGEVEISRLADAIRPENVDTANDYVVGIATVLTADYFSQFYWGYRYFVTFIIRPIPKQIWPTKYEDMGADWLLGYGDYERIERYRTAVGFKPEAGTAVGFVADLYIEFSWGAPVIAYILGRGLAELWLRQLLLGGVWAIVFLESLILSVYLPTQSLSAYLQRFLLMAGATGIAWRNWGPSGQPPLRRPSRAHSAPSARGRQSALARRK